MGFVLIIYAQIISLLLKTTSSQYEYQNVQNAYYQNSYQPYQNGYPVDGFETHDEYEDPQNYQRSRKQRRKTYINGGIQFPSEDYSNEEWEECNCSCNKCEDPEPCCKNTCNNCNTQNQQNLVIVPYPYPLVVTPKVIATETTTCTTTNNPYQLLQQVVTETNPPIILSTSPKSEPLRQKPNHLMTSLRRTKPVWLPKYGIVPIPDRLAEKLMSKLREVKGLKAE